MEKTVIGIVSKYDRSFHADDLKWNLKMAGVPVELDYVHNKLGEGLTIVYNRIMQRHPDAHRFVFMHDDVLVNTAGWVRKINELFDNNPEYGIIGVAGSKTFLKEVRIIKKEGDMGEVMSDGRWWTVGDACYGRVIHTIKLDDRDFRQVFMTSFSKEVRNMEEVAVVDGLFIAVDNSRATKPFDERFRGFHMYDITYCLSNFHENGCKIGVTTAIQVKHRSAGDSSDPKFIEARDKMLELYDDKLPIVNLQIIKQMNTTNEQTDGQTNQGN